MKKYSLVIFSLLVASVVVAKTFKTCTKHQEYTLQYPQELVELAASIGMELLTEKEFLHDVQIYGGEGTPYVFNVLTQDKTTHSKIPASVLFWCKKGKKKYLVYAVDNGKDKKHCNYEVKSILGNLELYGFDSDSEDTSRGLVVYDGIPGNTKDLSHFTYLDNRDERGPEGVYPERSNGFLPIIMYTESSTAVLYYYNSRWLEYVEVDE